jgi:hypothetical protein
LDLQNVSDSFCRNYEGSTSPGEDSLSPTAEQSKRTSECEDRWEDKSFARYLERGEEETRYAKFVYDITQEIVRNGLYTDRELKAVFERHLERSSGHLNKVRYLTLPPPPPPPSKTLHTAPLYYIPGPLVAPFYLCDFKLSSLMRTTINLQRFAMQVAPILALP